MQRNHSTIQRSSPTTYLRYMLQPHPALDNLELIARQTVEGFIIGLHKSPFHGFSVEFAEHRLYNQGDPLRHIDWRVFARTDKLFIKRFEEETNLRCCIVLDTSSSMYFPKEENMLSKLQFGCISAACILQMLKRQLDAATLALFDESLYYFPGVRSASSHYRMLTARLELLLSEPPKPNTSTQTARALHQIAEQMHRRSLVVVFSDVMDDPEAGEDLFAALQHLRYNKHEVILFHIVDKQHEVDFNFENRPYEFVDMESGERVRLQPQQVRAQYVARMAAWQKTVEARCHQYNIDRVPVDLSEPVEQVLHAFLLKRSRLG